MNIIYRSLFPMISQQSSKRGEILYRELWREEEINAFRLLRMLENLWVPRFVRNVIMCFTFINSQQKLSFP